MRHLALLLSGTVWAGMMALLVQREILPYFEYQQPPSYRVRLRDKKTAEAERRAVYFTDARVKVGEAETLTEPLPEGGALLRTRFRLDMSPFSKIKLPDPEVVFSTETRVDADYQLTEFKMEGRVSFAEVRIRGRRTGTQMLLTYGLFGKTQEKLVELPPDAVLSDNFTPYAGGGRLEEGKKWRMRLVDVGSLLTTSSGGQIGFTEKFATVTGREVIRVGGRDVPAWKVSVQEQPNDEPEKWDYQIWVDESGTVVQQLMKIERLPCTVVLEQQRSLTPEQARDYVWTVRPR
jgi:hypothetical protein